MTTSGELTETLGSVTSSDGTTIGYRRIGKGPALILLHGAMQSSGSFTTLARLLAPSFTVYVPDRRGRGLSGPAGTDYGLESECDDLAALIEAVEATRVFGLSAGALIALCTAYRYPGIEKLALYEPPLITRDAVPIPWAARYESDIERGDLAAAMASVIKGTGDRSLFTAIPRVLLVPMLRRGIAAEAEGSPDKVTIGSLIPTVRRDIKLPGEVGPLEQFDSLGAEILLLGGERSQRYLTVALDALAALWPKAQRVEFKGLGHIAADNSGKPQRVADALHRFFG